MYLDKGIPYFGRIRFADLTLKPRLTEHQDRQTVSFFLLHVAIRNSLRSNNLTTINVVYALLRDQRGGVDYRVGIWSLSQYSLEIVFLRVRFFNFCYLGCKFWICEKCLILERRQY